MEIGVEISLYPLADEYHAPIKVFLERLHAAAGLKVVTTSLSTQIFGTYEAVFDALGREIRATLGTLDRAVFVLKVFGPLAPP